MDDGAPILRTDRDLAPRFKFDVDLVRAMVAADMIDDDVELIDGDLYPMMSKNNPHEIIKRKLVYWLIKNLDESQHLVGLEQTIYLAKHDAPDPDILIFPAHLLPEDVRGPDALLVIEVANTSLYKDKVLKAPRYARNGVRHYWVLDVNANVVLMHADPVGGAYPKPREVPFSETLALPFRPDLQVNLAAL